MVKSINVTLNSYSCLSGDAQQANYYFNWSSVLDRNKKYRGEGDLRMRRAE